MHTHSETRNDLAIYLATGVTTVLHMGGARAGFVDTIVPAVNRGATYAAIANQIGRPDVVASYLARPESAYLSPNDRLAWQTSGYLNKSAKLGPKLAFLRKLVKAMAEEGVELVAGTDAPTVPGILPGFSLHDALTVAGRRRPQSARRQNSSELSSRRRNALIDWSHARGESHVMLACRRTTSSQST
jgi:hypothetical protein